MERRALVDQAVAETLGQVDIVLQRELSADDIDDHDTRAAVVMQPPRVFEFDPVQREVLQGGKQGRPDRALFDSSVVETVLRHEGRVDGG